MIIVTQFLQNATQFTIRVAIFTQKLLLSCTKLFWTLIYISVHLQLSKPMFYVRALCTV